MPLEAQPPFYVTTLVDGEQYYWCGSHDPGVVLPSPDDCEIWSFSSSRFDDGTRPEKSWLIDRLGRIIIESDANWLMEGKVVDGQLQDKSPHCIAVYKEKVLYFWNHESGSWQTEVSSECLYPTLMETAAAHFCLTNDDRADCEFDDSFIIDAELKYLPLYAPLPAPKDNCPLSDDY